MEGVLLRASDGHSDLLEEMGAGKCTWQTCTSEFLAGSAFGGLGLNEKCGAAMSALPRGEHKGVRRRLWAVNQ